MNSRMRRAHVWPAPAGGVLLLAAWLACIARPAPARADVTIRLLNGREIVARTYWYDDEWVLFSRAQGTVGVPRSFVAAIVAAPTAARTGRDAGPEAVDADGSADGRADASGLFVRD